MRATWPLLLVLFAKTAAADVLPPPEPMRCGPGQEVTTDHGGTRCVFRTCASDSDCPSGMVCVGMDETYCDPRGEPCSTSRVWRCNDDPRAGDPPPRPPPPEPRPEPERKFAQPPPGDSSSGAVIATGDAPQSNPDPNGNVLVAHRRSGCACSAVGAGAPIGGALLTLLGATSAWARRRRRRARNESRLR